ncbi:MAG TPA: hydroxymethylbilane synthase [Thermoanaerobaculia bacterium]
MTNFRIGTRGSELALWQAHEVARKLAAEGHGSTIIKVRTSGDQHQNVPLSSIGGKGLFVKELEEALARREIDIAVHSLKDVPSLIPARFVLASFLERADARDVWISRHRTPVAELKPGAVVGTSSPRRRAQLLSRFPHLRFDAIRGNIDTRLNKVREGVVNGIVLACAGLQRLDRLNVVTSYFAVEEMVPAAGQGVIAIETRADATHEYEAVTKINHRETEVRARCERGVLQHFGDQIGCDSAIGVHATIRDRVITLRAVAAGEDGRDSITVIQCGTDSRSLVRNVFGELVEKGAMDLLLAATT